MNEKHTGANSFKWCVQRIISCTKGIVIYWPVYLMLCRFCHAGMNRREFKLLGMKRFVVVIAGTGDRQLYSTMSHTLMVMLEIKSAFSSSPNSRRCVYPDMTITNAEKQHTANIRPPHQLTSTHMPFHHCYYTPSPQHSLYKQLCSIY